MPVNWAGMTGDRSLVRIGTRAADEGTCPEQAGGQGAARRVARGSDRARGRSSWTTSRWAPSWTSLTTWRSAA